MNKKASTGAGGDCFGETKDFHKASSKAGNKVGTLGAKGKKSCKSLLRVAPTYGMMVRDDLGGPRFLNDLVYV